MKKKRLLTLLLVFVMILTMPGIASASEFRDEQNIYNKGSSQSYLSNTVKYNNHCYKLFNGVADTWEEAKKFCEQLGGYLAVIDNKKENDFLYNYIRRKGYRSVYFGITDRKKEGTWLTVHGKPLKYKNWSYGEPNNMYSNEDYGMFFVNYSTGYWNDGDFGYRTTDDKAFLCEWGKTTTQTHKHKWSAWKTTKKATIFETGKQERSCSSCGKKETKTIAKLKATGKFKKSKYTIGIGKSISIKPTGIHIDDKVKKYVSSNSKIFTVNGTGKVTAKSAGTATLTAYLASGKKLSTKITVIAGWITYELNGGKNSKGNPTMYTGKRDIVLKNPTKNGYVFLGWYQDHYFEQPIYKIKKGTTGNIKLYAKWRNIHEFYDSIPN